MPHIHYGLQELAFVSPAATDTWQLGVLLCINASATPLISESLPLTWVCRRLGHMPECWLHEMLSIGILTSMWEGRIHNVNISPNLEGFSNYDKKSWVCHIATPVLPITGRQPFFTLILWNQKRCSLHLMHFLLVSVADTVSNPEKGLSH